MKRRRRSSFHRSLCWFFHPIDQLTHLDSFEFSLSSHVVSHMGEVVETQPTIGCNVEEVIHKNVHFVRTTSHQFNLNGQIEYEFWRVKACRIASPLSFDWNVDWWLCLFLFVCLFVWECLGFGWSRVDSFGLVNLFPWYSRCHHSRRFNWSSTDWPSESGIMEIIGKSRINKCRITHLSE